MAPKALQEARRCQSVRKLLFPLARAPAECGKNGPSIHLHGGIRVRQMPIFLRVRSSLNALVNMQKRSNGVEGQIELEIKRCGPTRVGADA